MAAAAAFLSNFDGCYFDAMRRGSHDRIPPETAARGAS